MERGTRRIQQQTPGAREHHAREGGSRGPGCRRQLVGGKQTGVRAVTSARKNHSLRVRDGRRQKETAGKRDFVGSRA